MQVRDLLTLAQKEHLRTEMEVFLSYLLDCDRSDLIAHDDKEIPVEYLAELQTAWVKMRDGYPVAYLTGKKEFFRLDFMVDERVLTPRDATEHLVEWILELNPDSVLEIGTGSGAIAVSLKHERPEMRVVAGEVSSEALEVARENAKKHGADVEFHESDLLNAIPRGNFEVLVANLPYIGEEKNRFVAENVEKYEPNVALFGGHDGLELYRKLLKQAQDWNFKWIMGEVGFTHGEAIREVCEEHLPNYKFELRQDYEGLDRHFILTRK